MNREATSPNWDCIIVGAGPAGLNAALVLGRARWRVVVLDDGAPRNYATHEMHGVLGHDGLDPAELRARGRAELARYGVQVATREVQDAQVLDGAVRVICAGHAELTRTVLLATGMLDEVPDIPASGTSGAPARTPVRTATATSTVTSGSPSSPPVTAASTSRCCCASGQTTASCSAMARTTSPSTSSRGYRRSASPSSRRPSSGSTATTGACAASGS